MSGDGDTGSVVALVEGWEDPCLGLVDSLLVWDDLSGLGMNSGIHSGKKITNLRH